MSDIYHTVHLLLLPPDIQAIADEWRRGLNSTHTWRKHPTRSFDQGGDGGFIVESDDSRLAAYLKPTVRFRPPDYREQFVAANEKICSDLAHDVGVSVPPVQLYHRPNPEGAREFDKYEERTCVSLVMYPHFTTWETIRNEGNPALALAQSHLAHGSGIIAFDTFVGNNDRSNDRNTVFGSDSTRPRYDRFMFVDLSHTLGWEEEWNNEGWRHITVAPAIAALHKMADLDELRQTLDAIEALNPNEIDTIVDRIPEAYMPVDRRNAAKAGLKYRKDRVREALKLQFVDL